MSDIKSPCVSVCEYTEIIKDDIEKVCRGCKRTAEEIEEWYFATDDRRKEILKNCQQRKVEEEYRKDLLSDKRTDKILKQSNQ